MSEKSNKASPSTTTEQAETSIETAVMTQPETEASIESVQEPSNADSDLDAVLEQAEERIEESKPAPVKSGRGLAIFAILLVLITAGGVGFLGWQFYLAKAELVSVKAEQATQQQNLNQQAADLQATNENYRTALSQEFSEQIQQQANQNEQNWTDLSLQIQQLQGRRPQDWTIAEANFLARMAGKKLWLDHDVHTASMLLKNAEEQLSSLQDPSLLPVVQQLQADQQILAAIDLPNISQIGMNLTGLQQLTDLALLSSAKVPDGSELESRELTESVADWRINMQRSLDRFIQTFFVIHKRDGGVQPMLAPEQVWYVRENIKTQLLLAQLAAEKGEQLAYQEALLAAENWATRYFSLADGSTTSLLAQIARLRQLTVTLDVPEQLSSIMMLKALVDKRAQQTLTQQLQTEADNG